MVGFTNPMAIFISTVEKSGKDVLLGLFINSNFKECYEGSCGDDSSAIYSFSDKMDIYKPKGSSRRFCFIINSKSLSDKSRKMGIGMGKTNEGHKIWIDNNDLFGSSYFTTEDDVFQSGSPYESFHEKLDVINYL